MTAMQVHIPNTSNAVYVHLLLSFHTPSRIQETLRKARILHCSLLPRRQLEEIHLVILRQSPPMPKLLYLIRTFAYIFGCRKELYKSFQATLNIRTSLERHGVNRIPIRARSGNDTPCFCFLINAKPERQLFKTGDALENSRNSFPGPVGQRRTIEFNGFERVSLLFDETL